MQTYYCKLNGDFNSEAALDIVKSYTHGGMSHSTEDGKPTEFESQITFSLVEPDADSALRRIKQIASTVGAESWDGSVMIFGAE